MKNKRINLNNILDEEIKACKREVKPIHINLVKEGDVHVGVLPFTLTSGEYLHTSAGLKEEIVTVTSEHSLLS
ncbi:MAG TPA: hypothetical protein EYO73_07740 [Sulfurimonas sp.]|nr:hypothetical protein [Sulfurimonas sp.]